MTQSRHLLPHFVIGVTFLGVRLLTLSRYFSRRRHLLHAPSILPVRHTFSNPSPVIICPTNPSWCLFITFIGSLSDAIYSKTSWFVVCDTLQGAERATWHALSESAELTTLSTLSLFVVPAPRSPLVSLSISQSVSQSIKHDQTTPSASAHNGQTVY